MLVRSAASILKPALESAGVRVFMDFSDLEAGDPWPQRLVEAASHSMVVVVVLSRSYSQRFWCMYELEVARQNPRVLVIPIHFHPFHELVPDGGVAAYWASRDMAPECKHLVHPELWAENLHALDDQVQAYRRRTVSPDKNEEWQLAMRVVKRAVKEIPLPVELQDEVVGFKDQEASLLAQLPGETGPTASSTSGCMAKVGRARPLWPRCCSMGGCRRGLPAGCL